MSRTVNPTGRAPDGPATDLKRLFRDARRDPELAVLEGLHALKHALRFGAQVLHTAVVSPVRLGALADALAPDVRGRILAGAQTVPAEVFATLAPLAPSTGVIAIARRPPIDAGALLAQAQPAPVVLLEAPSDLGNIGACVRVAAAADAAGVLTTGIHDPWDPAALRGSAGLHFALPVARLGEDALARVSRGCAHSADGPAAEAPPPRDPSGEPPRPGLLTGPAIFAGGRAADARPLIALDPDGEPLRPGRLPPRGILAFGAERQGLSQELLDRADARVRLPMLEGVSSLNLATSVAAVLYSWRLVGVERETGVG
ncbi:MAG TPA: TrmH family RNA methyltransferase [Solirubrobacteraceae bacterium]|nr:TrmH family RNA methyltransferase [Solirubrobacteraceae bacterium]